MKSAWKTSGAIVALAVVVGMWMPAARADCGIHWKAKPGAAVVPQAWRGELGYVLPISEDFSSDSIVGMWHVTFTAKGNEGGPPDGTPIDNAIVVWHRDKTEIMNSGRPPQDGNFCMGVWEKVGESKYKLNHFAWGGNDTTNAPGGIGNPMGPTHIVTEVRLSADGKHYTGKFTLDAYDTSGNLAVHIVGVVAGTRITMETTVGDLL
ncbi:MAG TPA: hypothetical protein VEI01_08260 [Terriglobales bacterium]|nr:hypothetical protein [Terriglobales bacterium]